MELRILSVVGTRPEAIKLAPVVTRLADTPGVVSLVCATAQHREMLDQVLSLFEIAWYAHRQGQLPSDYFHSWEVRMKQLGNEESFRRMLANPAMKIMHDDFDAYLRSIIQVPRQLPAKPA